MKIKKQVPISVYPRNQREFDHISNALKKINEDDTIFKKLSRSEFVLMAALEKSDGILQR